MAPSGSVVQILRICEVLKSADGYEKGEITLRVRVIEGRPAGTLAEAFYGHEVTGVRPGDLTMIEPPPPDPEEVPSGG
jgi:hypothetical protein